MIIDVVVIMRTYLVVIMRTYLHISVNLCKYLYTTNKAPGTAADLGQNLEQSSQAPF